MNPCPWCGSTNWNILTDACANCGGTHGAWYAAQAAYGGANAASGASAGAGAAQLAAAQQANFANAPSPFSAGATAGVGLGSPAFVSSAPMHGMVFVQASGVVSTKPPPPLETGPMVVGELVGWRLWMIKSGFLASYAADYAWTPGRPAEGRPGDYDGAGVWAFKDAGKALHKCVIERLKPAAVGSVWLWGEVIEHSDGYRAEYAEVRSIDHVITDLASWAPHRLMGRLIGRAWANEWLAQDLRQRYGVSETAAD